MEFHMKRQQPITDSSLKRQRVDVQLACNCQCQCAASRLASPSTVCMRQQTLAIPPASINHQPRIRTPQASMQEPHPSTSQVHTSINVMSPLSMHQQPCISTPQAPVVNQEPRPSTSQMPTSSTAINNRQANDPDVSSSITAANQHVPDACSWYYWNTATPEVLRQYYHWKGCFICPVCEVSCPTLEQFMVEHHNAPSFTKKKKAQIFTESKFI